MATGLSDVVRGGVRGAARPRGLLERPQGRAASPPPHPWIRGADPGHGGLGGGGSNPNLIKLTNLPTLPSLPRNRVPQFPCLFPKAKHLPSIPLGKFLIVS